MVLKKQKKKEKSEKKESIIDKMKKILRYLH